MKEAIKALNQLVENNLIEDYAIGGAIGAAFYIEAVRTEDVDFFVVLKPEDDKSFLPFKNIYPFLIEKHGGIENKEHIIIGNWPIQLLPVHNDLLKEALKDSRECTFQGEKTKVLSPEYICALALQLGRTKDYIRYEDFVKAKKVDEDKLSSIMKKHRIVRKELVAVPQKIVTIKR